MSLFATMLVVCGKVNFTNLSRYSDLSERTYRRQYKQEGNVLDVWIYHYTPRPNL
ncbi:MAG: hypothetical protein KME10_19540 [Plectolyngbya sp. WJT66-NPBG17]|nr:hypothetical protein [Plectolyngbya sp. WJT66-NPBG17]MBW4527936.1 hypothetical protein [Phormidium tanganyikae FI6-MK23]